MVTVEFKGWWVYLDLGQCLVVDHCVAGTGHVGHGYDDV
jgi:hypothetical protein